MWRNACLLRRRFVELVSLPAALAASRFLFAVFPVLFRPPLRLPGVRPRRLLLQASAVSLRLVIFSVGRSHPAYRIQLLWLDRFEVSRACLHQCQADVIPWSSIMDRGPFPRRRAFRKVYVVALELWRSCHRCCRRCERRVHLHLRLLKRPGLLLL